MREVVLTKGLPASGKSTFAKLWVEANPHGRTRVNKDDLRRLLHGNSTEPSGYTFGKANEKEVLAARDAIVRNALEAGKSVVVDDTNFGTTHWDSMKAIAKSVDPRIQVRWEDFTDVPLKECLQRNKGREWEVPEEAILRMHKQFVATVEPDRNPEVLPHNPDLPDCIIVDMDGTLTLGPHNRSPYEWTKVGQDLHDVLVSQVATAYANDRGASIIIMSGRDGSCQPETVQWLKDNGIEYDVIFMRTAGDQRSDTIVKEELWDEYVRPYFNVLVAFDDRNSVVSTWRSLGIRCFQVRNGDF